MADDSNQMDFNTIIWELQRIEDLQQKQEEIQEELYETTEEVEEVKVSTEDVEKVIGIKESDKKKNVIDGDKLSTTLTTSEKKRYENIGKEFVAGAGKELENVRKAVQFKDAMSTVRNKFSEGVSKFKEGLKKAQKAGSFFGKLMIIIGLLGTIVMLFKDKILNAFPNLGETIQNIFDGAKNGIGNIFTGILEFLKDKLTEWGSSILSKVFSETIPSYVGAFFGVTLPESIITLYLGILSSFSSSAANMYNQRIVTDANNDMTAFVNGTGNAVREGGTASQQQNNPSQPQNDTSIDYLEMARQSQGRYFAHGDSANMVDLINTLQNTSALRLMDGNNESLLDYLNTFTTQEGFDIREHIRNNNFDTNTFFEKIKEHMEDNALTNNEVAQALNASISASLRPREGFAETRETSTYNIDNVVTNFRNVMGEIENQRGQLRRTIDDTREANRKRQEQIQNRWNEYREVLGEINAKEAIVGSVADALTALITTITEFLSGDKIATALTASFISLNEEFKNFFEDFNNFIDAAFGELSTNISQLVPRSILKIPTIEQEIKDLKENKIPALEQAINDLKGNNQQRPISRPQSRPTSRLPRGLGVSGFLRNLLDSNNPQQSQQNTRRTNPVNFNDVNFNAIVNVQLPQTNTSVANVINEVVGVDEELVRLMEESNVAMAEVIASFNRIYSLHAASKNYVDGETTKLSDQLNDHDILINGHTVLINANRDAINELSFPNINRTSYTTNLHDNVFFR